MDKLWNGRIFLCTMSITSFIIFISHSSVLVAFLSAGKTELPFQSLEELVEKPYFKAFVSNGSALTDSFENPHLPIFRAVKETFLIPCGSKCIAQSPNELQRIVMTTPNIVAFTTEALFNVKYNMCQATPAIRNKFLMARLHLSMKKGFLYGREVNKNILKLKEFGILQKIYKDIHTRGHCMHRDFKFTVGLENIFLIFLAYSTALFASAFALLVELFIYNYKKKNCKRI